MKLADALNGHRLAIRRVVTARHARNPRVIGSVLHGEDTESSDLDLLVDPTLFDIGAIRHELARLLGVPVDVATPNTLPDRVREHVLA